MGTERPLVLPGIENRVDEGPGGLDAIGAIEEGCVPTHAVIQKRSISAAFAVPQKRRDN